MPMSAPVDVRIVVTTKPMSFFMIDCPPRTDSEIDVVKMVRALDLSASAGINLRRIAILSRLHRDIPRQYRTTANGMSTQSAAAAAP
jgi:hypothetical protein